MLSGLLKAKRGKGWASELLIVGLEAVHARRENRFTSEARNINPVIRTDQINVDFMHLGTWFFIQ